MKYIWALGFLAMGVVVFLFTILLQPFNREIISGANNTALATTGNLSGQGFNELINSFIILPILLVGTLIAYGIYRLVKG